MWRGSDWEGPMFLRGRISAGSYLIPIRIDLTIIVFPAHDIALCCTTTSRMLPQRFPLLLLLLAAAGAARAAPAAPPSGTLRLDLCTPTALAGLPLRTLELPATVGSLSLGEAVGLLSVELSGTFHAATTGPRGTLRA